MRCNSLLILFVHISQLFRHLFLYPRNVGTGNVKLVGYLPPRKGLFYRTPLLPEIEQICGVPRYTLLDDYLIFFETCKLKELRKQFNTNL